MNLSLPVICEDISVTADIENPDMVELTFQSTGTFTASVPTA